MNPEIDDLYENYVRGTIDRRELLRRLALVAGGATAAAALLPAFESGRALGQSCAEG